MKALTICQPYASLIANGQKRCENRRWPTNVRGRIAIHAGKSREWLDTLHPDEAMPSQMPFGAVIATANLTACVPIDHVTTDGPYAWMLDHIHAEGPFCFVLEDVTPIDPIPFRGAQGFFLFPDRLIPVEAK